MLEQLIEEACDLYDWIALLWAAFWRDSWQGMARQRQLLKELCIVAERSEVAVFVLRHHTRMIANQDGSVYSTRCSAANAVYREDQWQRRSKHTELES
jgi:hypothetical protein